jgi:RNA-binding protein 26
VSKTEITGSSHRGVGRGYPRGRAMFRGRGAYAGRGAAPVRSLKLDNRPRKLAVRGVDSGDGASVSTLENWYKVRFNS